MQRKHVRNVGKLCYWWLLRGCRWWWLLAWCWVAAGYVANRAPHVLFTSLLYTRGRVNDSAPTQPKMRWSNRDTNLMIHYYRQPESLLKHTHTHTQSANDAIKSTLSGYGDELVSSTGAIIIYANFIVIHRGAVGCRRQWEHEHKHAHTHTDQPTYVGMLDWWVDIYHNNPWLILLLLTRKRGNAWTVSLWTGTKGWGTNRCVCQQSQQ